MKVRLAGLLTSHDTILISGDVQWPSFELLLNIAFYRNLGRFSSSLLLGPRMGDWVYGLSLFGRVRNGQSDLLLGLLLSQYPFCTG